jgi:hypothetical protein
MSYFLKGLTYSYNRNIGWQDRTIRTILGVLAAGGALYYRDSNFAIAAILGGVFLAQVVTVLSAKCPICYFSGMCTIGKSEKNALTSKGIPFERQIDNHSNQSSK